MFKTLERFPGYLFTEFGFIISKKTGKIMRSALNKKGYLTTVLINDRGCRVTVNVARIICTAWHGKPGRGMQVNHKKGIKIDNRPSEIEWVTGQQNAKHSYVELGRENRRKRDNLYSNSKLDHIQVAVIREVINLYSLQRIATYFRVCRKSIQNIKSGVTWAK